MKFTKKSLIEVLRAKSEGKSSYQARKLANVFERRVYQVWKEYLITGNIPEIGKGVGIPMKQIEEWEVDLIKESWEKYRVTKEEFLFWHNEVRPHRSLKFEILETPKQAFIRKRRKN